MPQRALVSLVGDSSPMVNRAVVLAHRLVLEGGSELSSANVALVRRTLASLAQIGVKEVCVVDGDAVEYGQRILLLRSS